MARTGVHEVRRLPAAKHDFDRVGVERRDVLFLCHAKLKDAEQAAVWKKLVENTLEPPDTWEVALSAGKDKRENFQRLLREGELGGMAVLREKAEEFCIATFSDACVELPPRRGFAWRDGADRGLHCGRGGRGCGLVR